MKLLFLTEQQIDSFESLAHVDGFEGFDDTLLSHIAPADAQELCMGGNNITNFTGVGMFLNLTYLSIRNNILSSLEGIDSLVHLRELTVNNNKLTSFIGLENMVNLTQLIADNNQLTSIAGVESLTNLKILSINNNKLKSLDCIHYLINLEMLFVDNNNLTNFTDIEHLHMLVVLNIRGNRIKSLISSYKINLGCYILPTNNPFAPFNKLNLIKYVERNNFNIFNYWQYHRKFSRHFKINIYNILKNLLIADFKNQLQQNRYIMNRYPQLKNII
jgi:hypothetical protein